MAATLEITSSIARYQAEMAKIPGMTERAAAQAATRFVSQHQRGQQAAARASQRAAQQSGAAWKQYLGGAITGMISVGAIRGLATKFKELAMEVIDLRNELTDTSARTGLAADTIQTFGLAAKASGQEMGTFLKVGEKLPKIIADADAGLSTAVRGFDALGIKVHQAGGKLKTTDEILMELVGATDDFSSSSERAVRYADLLGSKVSGKFLQALGGGAESFKAMSSFAKEWGTDTGPEATRVASEAQVMFAALELTTAGLKDQLFSLISGTTEALLNWGTAFVFAGSTIIGTLDGIKTTIASFGAAFDEVGNAEGVLETAGAVGVVAAKLATIPLTPLKITAGAAGAAAETTRKWREETKQLIESLRGAAVVGDDYSGSGRDAAKADKAAAAAARSRAKAADDVARIMAQARADQLSDEEKILQAQEEQLVKLVELGWATQDRTATLQAMAEVEARGARDITALHDKLAAERKTEHEAELLRLKEQQQAQMGAASTLFGGLADLAGWAADQQTKQQGKAARRWFDFYKMAAITQIGVDTATAIMKGFAQLGPIGGAFASAGLIAAGIAQAGVVASKNLPAAYTGYDVPYASPAGTPIMVHPGESVVDRSKTSSGRDGGGQPIMTQTWLRMRPIADGWAREVRRGGAARAELTRITGQLTGHAGGYRRS
jgi:hypothetical protein